MKLVKLRFRDHCIKWLGALLIKFLWLTCKVRVLDEVKAQNLLESDAPLIPCYWHQHHLFGLWYLRRIQKQFGKKVGVLASPSRDGEIPSRIIERWGLHVIRGSSSKTGAQALRDLCKSVNERNISPSITPDGPRGPIFEAKPGSIMLSQHTGAAIMPIKFKVSRYWSLRSWDKFVIPKPFSEIIITIVEPIIIDRKMPISELAEQQKYLTKAML